MLLNKNTTLAQKIQLFLIAIIVLIGSHGLGVWYQQQEPYNSFNLIDESEIPDNFHWLNFHRQDVKHSHWKYHWTLVSFGSLQDIQFAEFSLTQQVRISNWLADRPDLQQSLNINFISTNEKDTFKQLRDFIIPFHPDFNGLKATPEQLPEISQWFENIASAKENYLYVFSPEAKLIGYFNLTQDPSKIAADLKRLDEQYTD